ncbi:MAG: hypothetical protein ACJ0DI_15535 [bacterium]
MEVVISEDGTLTTDPGEYYAFGLTLGSQETSQSMRIDAILGFFSPREEGGSYPVLWWL